MSSAPIEMPENTNAGGANRNNDNFQFLSSLSGALDIAAAALQAAAR